MNAQDPEKRKQGSRYRLLKSVLGAAKPNIVEPSRRWVPVPGRGAHIVRWIEPGPAAKHFGFTLCWPYRIPACVLPIIIFVPPVRHPLPDVPSHVVKTVRTLACFIGFHRCEAFVIGLLLREPFPEVGEPRCRLLISPRLDQSIRSASGFFPFRLRR